MDIVYAKFTVSITQSEYGWADKKSGGASITIRSPRSVLDDLDAGGLFIAALRGALAEFDASDLDWTEKPLEGPPAGAPIGVDSDG